MARMMTQLTHRGVLEIQGEDKAPFLQGLISNDIYDVSPEHAIYTTFLTPQGRFLYDFFIIEKEGAYYLDVEALRLADLLKKLSLYKLRSRVSLTPRPDLKVFAFWGEQVTNHLHLKEERGFTRQSVFMDPRLIELGARALGEVTNNDFQVVTLQQYDLHRLRLGVPEGGRDLIPEKAILLESGLDELHAISWTKGCYLGQELTARTKYRGLVRKRLFPVHIEGEAPGEDAEIFLNGAKAGRMRSHAGPYGLALLRLEAFTAYQEGQDPFMCENAFLKPYTPFWMRLEDPS